MLSGTTPSSSACPAVRARRRSPASVSGGRVSSDASKHGRTQCVSFTACHTRPTPTTQLPCPGDPSGISSVDGPLQCARMCTARGAGRRGGEENSQGESQRSGMSWARMRGVFLF
ncbi:hypothetical protein EMIHUDRAFT_450490, partial [Emiliania huxleyi CCMP1516]|uniref:Uncharacterized protein n=2 Tax=Emiliania huxleyi TaxID=2903 RepID=A0A0D3JP11_EMIH1